jgi:lipoate-protein ligase A
MRLPRHDTPLSLSAEPPRQAIAADEALLETPTAQPRWWVANSNAVVVGLGLHHRLAEVVDLERAGNKGIDVLHRRAGGGALLLDEHMLCGAIARPTVELPRDVTESYRWLGDALVKGLRQLGVDDARRVEVAEARADVADVRERDPLLLSTCYGTLSPHEIVADGRKLVGLAQIRRRDTALFQFGILLRDQSPLAEFLRVPDEQVREELKDALGRRTVGLERLTTRSAAEVAAAIADAMPFSR